MLLKHVALPDLIHEPCAGNMAMSDVLASCGHHVVSTDISPRDPRVGLKDAMLVGPVDCVVTNPPYNALKTLVPYWLNNTRMLCLLVRLNFLEGKSRLAWTKSAKTVLVVAGRMKVFDKVSQFPHAWVVWEKGHSGPTELIIDKHYQPVV